MNKTEFKPHDRVRILVRKHSDKLRTRIDEATGITTTSYSTEEFYPIEEVAEELDLGYEIGGIDSRGFIWLSLIKPEDYDGYNGDVIVMPEDEHGTHKVMLEGGRTVFGMEIKIEKDER